MVFSDIWNCFPKKQPYVLLSEIKVIHNGKRDYNQGEDNGFDKAACHFLDNKHADNQGNNTENVI